MAIPEYAKLRDLSYGSHEFKLAAVLGNVLNELKPEATDLTFGIMTCGETRKRYLLETKKGSFREISEKDIKKPAPTRNWLIIGDEDALQDLLRGRVSPVTLIQQGSLRYVGSENCFTSIWSLLASSSGEVARPCDQ